MMDDETYQGCLERFNNMTPEEKERSKRGFLQMMEICKHPELLAIISKDLSNIESAVKLHRKYTGSLQ